MLKLWSQSVCNQPTPGWEVLGVWAKLPSMPHNSFIFKVPYGTLPHLKEIMEWQSEAGAMEFYQQLRGCGQNKPYSSRLKQMSCSFSFSPSSSVKPETFHRCYHINRHTPLITHHSFRASGRREEMAVKFLQIQEIMPHKQLRRKLMFTTYFFQQFAYIILSFLISTLFFTGKGRKTERPQWFAQKWSCFLE